MPNFQFSKTANIAIIITSKWHTTVDNLCLKQHTEA